MTEENPLLKLIRQPEVYVKLPSNGKFNNEADIDFTVDHTVSVRSMTANDEIISKNPDALLSGDATEQIIKSCVPAIKNVRKLPMNDIDVLLLAIKKASEGDKLSIKQKCPECGFESETTLSLQTLLDSTTQIPDINEVVLDGAGHTKITIVLKPYTFEQSNKISIAEFENKKRLAHVTQLYNYQTQNVTEANQREQRTSETNPIIKDELKAIFDTIANLTLDLIIESIIQVNFIEGTDNEGKPLLRSITDKSIIKEFIWNLDSQSYAKLKEKMDEIMAYGLNKDIQIQCDNPNNKENKPTPCKHIFKMSLMEVGYDHSNFFG